jgi:hypothetical protein
LRDYGRKVVKFVVFAAVMLVSGVCNHVSAQQLSIPQLEACKNLSVQGKAHGSIAGRRDASHSGEFELEVGVTCRQGDIDRGILTLQLDAFRLNDTVVTSRISVDHLDQMTSVGKAVTPTAFLSGTCRVERESESIAGCRFWLMLVDNGRDSGAGDIISFVVIDGAGRRLAYGTGTLTTGEIRIEENE